MATTWPDETNAGITTSWTPLTTQIPVPERCSSTFRLSTDEMTAFGAEGFDPSCLPPAAKMWWNQDSTPMRKWILVHLFVHLPTTQLSVRSLMHRGLGQLVALGMSTKERLFNPNTAQIPFNKFTYFTKLPASTPYECHSVVPAGQTLTYGTLADTNVLSLSYTSMTYAVVTTVYAIHLNGFNTFDGGSPLSIETVFEVPSTSTSAPSSNTASPSLNGPSPTGGSSSAATLPLTNTLLSPSPTTTTTDQTQTANPKNIFHNTGARAGISVGITVFVVLIGYLFFYSLRHRHQKHKATPEVDEM